MVKWKWKWMWKYKLNGMSEKSRAFDFKEKWKYKSPRTFTRRVSARDNLKWNFLIKRCDRMSISRTNSSNPRLVRSSKSLGSSSCESLRLRCCSQAVRNLVRLSWNDDSIDHQTTRIQWRKSNSQDYSITRTIFSKSKSQISSSGNSPKTLFHQFWLSTDLWRNHFRKKKQQWFISKWI